MDGLATDNQMLRYQRLITASVRPARARSFSL